jgi:hypothetical protein
MPLKTKSYHGSHNYSSPYMVDYNSGNRNSLPRQVSHHDNHSPILRRIPSIHKGPLRLIRIILSTNLLDPNFRPVFCKDYVFLFEFVDAALREFVGVEEDLLQGSVSERLRAARIVERKGVRSGEEG